MKRLILTFILILIISLPLISCAKKELAELRFVEYTKIVPEIPENKKEFFGYIKAGGDMELSFETAGTIKKINFTDGDAVRKGQVIAEIDNKIFELEEKENRSALADAYVQYENAKCYYERIDKLHKVGGISDNDWDKAKTEMQSREHQIAISKEQLEASRKRVSYGKLYAPDNGIILKKLKEENQYTDPGQAVVIFQDNRKSEAKIFVSEKYINSFYKGKDVEIKTDAQDNIIYANNGQEAPPQPKTAKIKSITKTSIDEGAYRVTLIFDKKYPELKDGMAIRALVEFTPGNDDLKKIIKLPPNAVLEDENSSYVWLLEDIKNNIAKVKRQNIKTLDMIDDSIIVEGLRRNDLVVVRGANEIMDGQKVKIKSLETE